MATHRVLDLNQSAEKATDQVIPDLGETPEHPLTQKKDLMRVDIMQIEIIITRMRRAISNTTDMDELNRIHQGVKHLISSMYSNEELDRFVLPKQS